jgi:anthranilate/para-aminobenzoate synthase component II
MTFSRGLTVTLIDHQDSFTQTIASELQALGAQVRLSQMGRGPGHHSSTHSDVLHACDGIVLSPGPGHPDEYDNLWLRDWLLTNPQIPTFGICLGLQILLHWSGIRISQIAEIPVHGRIAPLALAPGTIRLPEPFASIPPQSQVVWYNSLGALWDDFLAHGSRSWLAAPSEANPSFVSLASHRALPWCGVQFHPESFATPTGSDFFAAFLKLCAANRAQRKR